MGGCMSYRLKLVRECDELIELPNIENLFKKMTPFSFKTLKKSTNNFNPTRVIRYNVSSTTYKGILEDGSEVIVMVYYDRNSTKFETMIRTMSGVKHKNVVELIGYCIEGDHRILVHEFVGENSLDQVLFCDAVVLDWPTRVSVCRGIAYGFDHLHNAISPCVVHCNIKPSNILMDCNFNPKIADFELSCLLEKNESYRSGVIDGTLGYIDPELYMTGRFSEKTDVYSFGITLLEIINGNRNSLFSRGHVEDSLTDWAWKLRESGRISEIVDGKLAEYSEDEVTRLVNVALSCVQLPSDRRPNMSEVRLFLSNSYDYNNNNSVLTALEIPIQLYSPPKQWSSDDELSGDPASDEDTSFESMPRLSLQTLQRETVDINLSSVLRHNE